MQTFTHSLPLLFLSAVLIVVPSKPSVADDVLDEIIVSTSTKTERKLLDVPVRTEVVSQKALNQTHARDIAEALKNVPGLLLRRIHGKSGQEVWLQGLDADRVLVLIDGKPVSASTGSSVDLSQISVGDVEHIEIVKGAASVLYGSEAMGGVVNIITKKYDKPFAYSMVLDSGSYGNKNVGDTFNDKHAKLNLATQRKHWHLNLSADVRDKQGTDLDKSTWSYEGDAGTKSNLAFELGYTSKSGTKIKLKPTYYKEDLSRNFSSFSPGSGIIKKQKLEEATRSNLTLSYEKPFTNGDKLAAWFIHEQFEDISQQDIVKTPFKDQARKGNSRFNKAEIQWDKNIGEKHLVTLGVVGFESALKQIQTKRSSTQTILVDEINGTQKRHSIEAFIQDDIFVNDWFEVLPGFRYQHDSDFGSHTAPKLSLMYSPKWSNHFDTRLRFSVGKGYRVPTLKDRHYVFDHSALGYMVLGNKALQPETSTSVTAGIELISKGRFRTELHLFNNDIDDLIGTELDQAASNAQSVSVYRYTNIDKAQTRGIDLNGSYQFNPNLKTSASYSYLRARDKNTGKKLTRRPAHQLKLQLHYAIPHIKTEVGLYANYQSKEYINSENTRTSPAYSTFDLKLNKEVRKGLKVFLGIDNLTDTHRSVPLTGSDFRPETGRFVYAGIRIDG